MADDRNADVLRRIISYCHEIEETIRRFGKDYAVFAQDSVYRNATALCVMQIGELTTHFTNDFKQTYTGMPWTQIKALRNVVAHSYGNHPPRGCSAPSARRISCGEELAWV